MENLYLSNILCVSELIYLIRYEKIYDTKGALLCNGKWTDWKSFPCSLIATYDLNLWRSRERSSKSIPGLCKLKT